MFKSYRIFCLRTHGKGINILQIKKPNEEKNMLSLFLNSRKVHCHVNRTEQIKTDVVSVRLCFKNFSSCPRLCSKDKRQFTINSSKTQNPNSVLMFFIRGSFVIGFCLIAAIVYRELEKGKQRLKGIERVVDPVKGGKALMILYKDVALPIFVENSLDAIKEFKTNDDDVWVISYPRSGTTWLSEIVYLLQNELSFDDAKNKSLEERVPYFEYIYPGIESIKKMPSPRLIKSHLPYRLLPDDVRNGKQKIIYIARNPKDTCVSYYHFVKMLKTVTRFDGNFGEFFDRFVNGKVPYSPWWRHVTEFWEVKDQENILFIKYEDLLMDYENTVKKIADFLGKKCSFEDIKKVADFCSFEKMKANKMVNMEWWKEAGISDKNESDFIRRGKVGLWRAYFDQKMNIRIEQMKALKLRDLGLEFDEGDNVLFSLLQTDEEIRAGEEKEELRELFR